MSDRQPARSTTPRGFTIYDEFTDQRGAKLRVQQSSSATEDCVWIFCEDEERAEYDTPHLNVEQATWLRDALDVFIREQDQAGEPDGE